MFDLPDDLSGLSVLNVGEAQWGDLARERKAHVVDLPKEEILTMRPGLAPLDRMFDIVLCIDVLNDCEKPILALERIRNMLVPNGKVLIQAQVSTIDKVLDRPYNPDGQVLSVAVLTVFSSISSYKADGNLVSLWAHKKAGLFVFITGPSGSGKTTLAQALRKEGRLLLLPDIDMGLDVEVGPWGLDFMRYFQDSIREGVKKHSIIIAEATMPDAGTRHALFNLIPPDWGRFTIFIDLLEEEFGWVPYAETPGWAASTEIFNSNAPTRRKWNINNGPILILGPGNLIQNVAMVEALIHEFNVLTPSDSTYRRVALSSSP